MTTITMSGATDQRLLDLLLSQTTGGERKGMTSAEIAEATGRSRQWVTQRLQPLVTSGAVKVQTVRKLDVTGRNGISYEYVLSEDAGQSLMEL